MFLIIDLERIRFYLGLIEGLVFFEYLIKIFKLMRLLVVVVYLNEKIGILLIYKLFGIYWV